LIKRIKEKEIVREAHRHKGTKRKDKDKKRHRGT
jgi:hypothetical protein